MLAYWPNPTNNSISNNFAASASAPTNSNEFTIRIDHNLSDTARLYGRFSRKTEEKQVSAPLYGANNPAGPGQVNPDNRWDVALGYSQVLSPTLTGSANLGFARWVEGNDVQSAGFKAEARSDCRPPSIPIPLNSRSSASKESLGWAHRPGQDKEHSPTTSEASQWMLPRHMETTHFPWATWEFCHRSSADESLRRSSISIAGSLPALTRTPLQLLLAMGSDLSFWERPLQAARQGQAARGSLPSRRPPKSTTAFTFKMTGKRFQNLL